jgi:hypothetical protein
VSSFFVKAGIAAERKLQEILRAQMNCKDHASRQKDDAGRQLEN